LRDIRRASDKRMTETIHVLPKMLSAPEYVLALHRPDDRVAVVVRNRARCQTIQRILEAEVKHVHRSRKLTKATGPYQSKRAAEQLAEKMLRPLNDGELAAESTMTLNRFIDAVYLPYAERQRRRSTFLGYRNIWKRYIKPDGERALREYRTFECRC
jgi:hypothetical protein